MISIPLIIANLLTLLAFLVHTFVGDRELKLIEPGDGEDENFLKREKWTMARGGWHWISLDLLLATVGLALINFTGFFPDEQMLLHILAIYFLGYGIVWLIGIAISKPFPMNYIKLGQWLLFWLISGLIYWGS